MMALPINYSQQAEADVLEQSVYLGLANPAVAEHFFLSIEAATAGLAEMPGKGAPLVHPNPRMEGVRRWRMSGFPNHLVIYRVREGTLEVLRIVHGARDLDRLFSVDDLDFTF